ncbi:unnamed protein product, partial [marine sediment metagenome]
MKKRIFAIFVALALVLTLGLVTAAPVGAVPPPSTFTVTDGIYTTVPHADPLVSGDISATLTGSWDTAILGGLTASGMSGSYFLNLPTTPPVWSTGT